jgi:phospho-N-acetylmuramoyl-pentapeptide-transferase
VVELIARLADGGFHHQALSRRDTSLFRSAHSTSKDCAAVFNFLIDCIGLPALSEATQTLQLTAVRAVLAAITALVIVLWTGRPIICWLRREGICKQESGKDGTTSVTGHEHKVGTPTMGGLIILLAVGGATLLWSALHNAYVWLALGTTVALGALGVADDCIGASCSRSGLSPRQKVAGQLLIGAFLGGALCVLDSGIPPSTPTFTSPTDGDVLSYGLFHFFWNTQAYPGWIAYVSIVAFVVTAVSNSVNLTDGLDGLTAGVTAFVSLGLVILSCVSGSARVAEALDVVHLPWAGELAVFAAAMGAACFGFLSYNSYPATVFMGDTGALALGGAVGSTIIMMRKELLLPLLGTVYFAEALSVVLQVTYFKYTRRRTGRGKRVFRMAPLHHHYEAEGLHEAEIVTRFWIAAATSVIAALFTLGI